MRKWRGGGIQGIASIGRGHLLGIIYGVYLEMGNEEGLMSAQNESSWRVMSMNTLNCVLEFSANVAQFSPVAQLCNFFVNGQDRKSVV